MTKKTKRKSINQVFLLLKRAAALIKMGGDEVIPVSDTNGKDVDQSACMYWKRWSRVDAENQSKNVRALSRKPNPACLVREATTICYASRSKDQAGNRYCALESCLRCS
jgi:hypothetical protein